MDSDRYAVCVLIPLTMLPPLGIFRVDADGPLAVSVLFPRATVPKLVPANSWQCGPQRLGFQPSNGAQDFH